MAIRGKVLDITTRSGDTNGRKWTMYRYKLDNGNYYTAFKKFPVNKGDDVEISMEEKNGHWNVKEIIKLNKSSLSNKQQVYKKEVSVNQDRELSIQRQSSIKAAIDIVNNQLNLAEVIKIANILVEYCRNGDSKELTAKLDEMVIAELGDEVTPFDLDENEKEEE